MTFDFISSLGHTVFHEPQKQITFQLGKGNVIARETGKPVIWDFRSGDVALGGQWAPLVPAGNRVLSGDFIFCRNLGGFSNISFEKNDSRIAFDLCPVNFVLYIISEELGLKYDRKEKCCVGQYL